LFFRPISEVRTHKQADSLCLLDSPLRETEQIQQEIVVHKKIEKKVRTRCRE
jgi:hypothetical protein